MASMANSTLIGTMNMLGDAYNPFEFLAVDDSKFMAVCESFEARARTADVLEAAFEANGFDVQRGAMWVFSHADIDPDCRDCSHANPSSTYGCAMLVRRGREPRGRGARFPSVERFVSGKQTTPKRHPADLLRASSP